VHDGCQQAEQQQQHGQQQGLLGAQQRSWRCRSSGDGSDRRSNGDKPASSPRQRWQHA
jgi:hypothetical protein